MVTNVLVKNVWQPLGYFFKHINQNSVKRVDGVCFQRNFWKIFKNEDFGFDIFEAFSGLAPSKLKFCSKKRKKRGPERVNFKSFSKEVRVELKNLNPDFKPT